MVTWNELEQLSYEDRARLYKEHKRILESGAHNEIAKISQVHALQVRGSTNDDPVTADLETILINNDYDHQLFSNDGDYDVFRGTNYKLSFSPLQNNPEHRTNFLLIHCSYMDATLEIYDYTQDSHNFGVTTMAYDTYTTKFVFRSSHHPQMLGKNLQAVVMTEVDRIHILLMGQEQRDERR